MPKPDHVVIKLTTDEAQAAYLEIETSLRGVEENEGPKHWTHHAAQRALKKLKAALDAFSSGKGPAVAMLVLIIPRCLFQ